MASQKPNIQWQTRVPAQKSIRYRSIIDTSHLSVKSQRASPQLTPIDNPKLSRPNIEFKKNAKSIWKNGKGLGISLDVSTTCSDYSFIKYPKLSKPQLLPRINQIIPESFESWSLPSEMAVASIDESQVHTTYISKSNAIMSDDNENDDLLEMQRSKISEITTQMAKASDIIHLRIPLVSEQKDGFKTFSIPIEALQISDTILHIINASGTFDLTQQISKNKRSTLLYRVCRLNQYLSS